MVQAWRDAGKRPLAENVTLLLDGEDAAASRAVVAVASKLRAVGLLDGESMTLDRVRAVSASPAAAWCARGLKQTGVLLQQQKRVPCGALRAYLDRALLYSTLSPVRTEARMEALSISAISPYPDYSTV